MLIRKFISQSFYLQKTDNLHLSFFLSFSLNHQWICISPAFYLSIFMYELFIELVLFIYLSMMNNLSYLSLISGLYFVFICISLSCFIYQSISSLSYIYLSIYLSNQQLIYLSIQVLFLFCVSNSICAHPLFISLYPSFSIYLSNSLSCYSSILPSLNLAISIYLLICFYISNLSLFQVLSLFCVSDSICAHPLFISSWLHQETRIYISDKKILLLIL